MNKILLKTVGVMALFFALLNLFIFVIAHLIVPYHSLATNMVIYCILLVMAFFSLVWALGGFMFLQFKDMSESELKEKKVAILVWSIIFLATANISGLLGLVAFVGLLSKQPSEMKINYIEELKGLEKLRAEGLITEKEFDNKKKKILNI